MNITKLIVKNKWLQREEVNGNWNVTGSSSHCSAPTIAQIAFKPKT